MSPSSSPLAPSASPAVVAGGLAALVGAALLWTSSKKKRDDAATTRRVGEGSIGARLSGSTHDTCVYLDYNATTPIFPEVAAAMEPFLWEHFGNPSSGHAFARPCKTAVDVARSQVARMLGCRPGEVIFTSCGSESDNHAIASAVEHAVVAKNIATPHVVTCSVEHPAILEYLIAAQAAGRLTYTAVGVSEGGVVDPADVAAAVTPNTCLVTVMHANNEVGAVQPVAAIAAAARAANPDVVVHTDAAQSCGKIPVKVNDLGVDMCTIVGHKIGAPKGVAALYVREVGAFGGRGVGMSEEVTAQLGFALPPRV